MSVWKGFRAMLLKPEPEEEIPGLKLAINQRRNLKVWQHRSMSQVREILHRKGNIASKWYWVWVIPTSNTAYASDEKIGRIRLCHFQIHWINGNIRSDITFFLDKICRSSFAIDISNARKSSQKCRSYRKLLSQKVHLLQIWWDKTLCPEAFDLSETSNIQYL